MVENPFETFIQAITEIQNTHREPFAELAKRTINRINNVEIVVKTNSVLPKLRATTVFGMLPVPGSLRQEHYPVIMLEVIDAIRMNPLALQGELVRTLAIADQFPFKGYERRLRTVYGQALDLQTQWLTETNSPQITLDPRQMDRERLILQLLGPAKYYLDTGFADWQAVIDEILESGLHEKDKKPLQLLRESQSHFLVQRHHQQPIIYNVLSSQGIRLEDTPEDIRVKTFCASVIGASLLSRPAFEH